MKVKISNDEKLSEQLQDPNLNPIVKENMLKEVTLTVMKELGYVSNDVKLVYTDEVGVNNTQVKGYFDDKTNTSYVNDKYNNSTTQLIASLGHEITHDMDKQDNIYVSNDKDQNIYATNFGEDLAFYTNGALSIMTGGSLASTNTHNSGRVTSQASIFNTSNDMLMSNNALFASLDKSGGDDRQLKSEEKDFISNISEDFSNEDFHINLLGKPTTLSSKTAELLLSEAALYYNNEDTKEYNDEYVTQFSQAELSQAYEYLMNKSEGLTFIDQPTQQKQNYFTSQDYMYEDSNWNPNVKEFKYIPNMITTSDNEILSNRITEQTWYERQKGAEEKFDFMATSGGYLVDYGVESKNPLLIKIGTGLKYGSTTMKYLVTPDEIKDYQIYNELVPKLFQVEPLEGETK